jgi:hypothetical protein
MYSRLRKGARRDSRLTLILLWVWIILAFAATLYALLVIPTQVVQCLARGGDPVPSIGYYTCVDPDKEEPREV